MVKVSVIVAAYNVSEYIEECLHSLINQTLEDAEFIIVDDGSTDDTGEIIKKWLNADCRLKLITHEKNKGLMLARKTGYDSATGEYIMFLDGDDSLDFKACETAYNAIKKSKVDILQFNADVIGDEEILEKKQNEIYGLFEYLKPLGYKVFSHKKGGLLASEISAEKINLSIWNKIYKKSIIDNVSKYIPDEHIIIAEDVLFSYISCFYAKSYDCIEKKLYNYRFGSGISTTNDISENKMISIAKCYWVYNYLENWTDKQNVPENVKERLKIIKKQMLINLAFAFMVQVPKGKKRNFLELVLKYITIEELISICLYMVYKNNTIPVTKLAEIFSDLELFKNKNNKCKTIGTFYHRMYNGGIENVVSQLTDIWVKSGYNVVLFTEEEPNENDYYINPSVTRVILPKYEYGILDSYRKRCEEFSKSLKEHNVDVMVYHAWINHNILSDELIIKNSGVSLVIHTHGVFCTEFSNPYPENANLNITLHKLYSLSDAVVSLNNADVAYWQASGNRAIRTINPIAFSTDIKPSKLGGKNIVMVSRLSQEKQILDGIKIVENVIKKIPDATLTIVGDGDDKYYVDTLNNYIKTNKLEKNIKLVGFKKNVIPYYQSADVMLITSKFEGFCLSLVESKLCGLPLVTYDLPNLDTVRESKGMFVVEQEDIETAAEKIIEILSDDDLKKKMGKEARESGEKIIDFDIAKHWDYIFDQAISPKEDLSQKSDISTALDILLDFTAKGIFLRGSNVIIGDPVHTAALEATIKEIRSSTSYRLGWFLTTIPRKIKDFIKGQKYVE